MSLADQERVRTMLQAIADGQGTLKEVAAEMDISYSCAKQTLKREYDRIGADSLAHLMAIYFRAHLVQ